MPLRYDIGAISVKVFIGFGRIQPEGNGEAELYGEV